MIKQISDVREILPAFLGDEKHQGVIIPVNDYKLFGQH